MPMFVTNCSKYGESGICRTSSLLFRGFKYKGYWSDPGPLVAAAIAKRNQIPGSQRDVPAFQINLEGVEDVEVFVNHFWMKKLRALGCLTVEKFKPNARTKVPHAVADTLAIPTSGIVDVPPFQLGATWNWPVIEAMQRVSNDLSAGKGLGLAPASTVENAHPTKDDALPADRRKDSATDAAASSRSASSRCTASSPAVVEARTISRTCSYCAPIATA